MNGYSEKPADFDVIIIGAGISGINSAYRVQTQTPPGTTYAILEGRGQLGGTWDFFKYPGLRSDSDLHTFGFAWRPWGQAKAIAEAPLILDYLSKCVAETGIDKHIKYNHKVTAAEWSSETCKWTLDVETNGFQTTMTGRWLILGTGYYNYDEPMEAIIPGIENFKGEVVHPQFWPEDLDYSGKKMVIIGSGATAITILPVVSQAVKHVTMLQRSPSYIMSMPASDPLSKLYHWFLPSGFAYRIDRVRFMLMGYFFFYFCRSFPKVGRSLLAKLTKLQLPSNVPFDPHFVPAYNPWEQRLCICPDGDFYKALRSGKADIATGHIKTITSREIILTSGEKISDVDILVTATGLKIHLAGGIKFTIDGKPLNIPEKFLWKGVMLQDFPNAAVVIGYTNASWTLGADATAQLLTRLMSHMHAHGYQAAIPRVQNPEKMSTAPMLNLNSTYIASAIAVMPKTGSEGQWRPRTNYFSDMKEAKRGDVLSGLEFLTAGRKGQ
jgi:cation diffusion facilitator CzcD-associated flavoprotein CzcO